jgi:Flp pilus assembly protein TadG
MKVLPEHNMPWKRNQRGVAAIEMAITLPVLLMLLLGTAELGRAFYQYNALTKSIRAAARYLSTQALDGTSGVITLTGAKQTATKNLVVYSNTDGGAEPIIASLGTGDVTVTQVDSEHIEVSVSFDYQPMFFRIPSFGTSASDVSTDLTLTASATMRAI